MDPLVSIVIPTFMRREAFLKRAVDSVLNQTYSNIEIVIVDDNATANNLEYRIDNYKLIERYDNPRIILHQNIKNLGGALSRNEGIKLATGEYIAFLDDDDEYLPNKITDQLNEMLANNWDVSFTDIRVCNEAGKTVDYREHRGLKSFDNNSLLEYHLLRHITATTTYMFKKKVLDEIKGFPDVKVSQEYYLMFNTINSGYKIGYIPEALAILYRHSEGSISTGNNKIAGEKELYVFKQKYFYMLSTRKKMFVRFRHHIVLAISFKRRKQIFSSLINASIAFLCSPIDAFIEGYGFIKRIKINSNNSSNEFEIKMGDEVKVFEKNS